MLTVQTGESRICRVRGTNSKRKQERGNMTSQYMDHKEVLMSIPVSGIPAGYRIIAIRPARTGETIVNHGVTGGVNATPAHWASLPYSSYPQIILEKCYDPGISIPNGWTVWKQGVDVWCASAAVNSLWGISGLQHFPEFVPPPNGISAIVKRQS